MPFIEIQKCVGVSFKTKKNLLSFMKFTLNNDSLSLTFFPCSLVVQAGLPSVCVSAVGNS